MSEDQREAPNLSRYAARGKKDGYTTFKLGVTIIVSPEGPMWSFHDFLDPEQDPELAMSLPSHGTRQIAQALLSEAFRREVYLCALGEQTKDDTFIRQFIEADEENRKRIAAELAQKARKSMMDVTGKIGIGDTLSTLEMIASQYPAGD